MSAAVRDMVAQLHVVESKVAQRGDYEDIGNELQKLHKCLNIALLDAFGADANELLTLPENPHLKDADYEARLRDSDLCAICHAPPGQEHNVEEHDRAVREIIDDGNVITTVTEDGEEFVEPKVQDAEAPVAPKRRGKRK